MFVFFLKIGHSTFSLPSLTFSFLLPSLSSISHFSLYLSLLFIIFFLILSQFLYWSSLTPRI
jgi:hypothetical protein